MKPFSTELGVMLFIWIILGACFGTSPPVTPVKKPEDKNKVVISIKRINFAYRVCKENGKIKEIQLKPQELVVCGNGAIFSK